MHMTYRRMKDDDKAILEEIRKYTEDAEAIVEKKPLHPLIATGIGVFFVANVALLLSLPPVLLGRGAPYLPTFQKNQEAMFRQLKSQPCIQRKMAAGQKLRFADLGSGDGRLVFRAAKEGIFHRSVGYEINPLLHALAHARRLVGGPSSWSRTDFVMRDLWKVDLRETDVVAVYGLGPIMKDLGVKLQDELKPGSFVLSNVFAIPGWKPVSSSSERTHIYKIPDD